MNKYNIAVFFFASVWVAMAQHSDTATFDMGKHHHASTYDLGKHHPASNFDLGKHHHASDFDLGKHHHASDFDLGKHHHHHTSIFDVGKHRDVGTAAFDIGKHYDNVARIINEASKTEIQTSSGELHPQASNHGYQGIDYEEPGKGGWWQGWAKGWIAGQKYAGERGFAPHGH